MSDDSNTQINVAQLLKSPIGTIREWDVEATVPTLDDDARLIEPVVGRVCVIRITGGVLAQGHFCTEVELTCDRCLGLFSVSVEFDLEEQFVSVVDVNTGRWLKMDEVDPVLLLDDHHILDLAEVFRQAIYLGLPMHPICGPECQGLCPRCGQSADEGSCGCVEDEIDPRWESLESLREG